MSLGWLAVSGEFENRPSGSDVLLCRRNLHQMQLHMSYSGGGGGF